MFLALFLSAVAGLPRSAAGQSMEVVGARAAGMAGAFVGVADDGSATYWNPGGLAAGSYFSLVLDGGADRAVPQNSTRGRTQSSLFLGAVIPALGLSYYRLQHRSATPYDLLVPIDGVGSSRNVTGERHVRVDSLVTHHAGITLVQTVLPNVSVGATLKLVHGVAASEPTGLGNADEALDRDTPQGRGKNEFDVDLGVMATLGSLKAGLTVRNVREPSFNVPEGDRILKLQRQARAGASYAVTPGVLLAADIDLLETDDAFGQRRDLAFGVEGRLARRLTARSGLRLNVVDSGEEDGSDRAFAVGGTFAVTAAVLIDGAAVTGGDRAGRGWRVAARFVY